LALAVVALLVAALGALSINAREASAASWGPAGSLSESRSHHTATKLNDGKVLVVGGRHGNSAGTTTPTTYRSSVDLYASSGSSQTATGALTAARSNHTATLLGGPACAGASQPGYCGKVLVVGGRNGTGALASTELYDPASGTWSSFAAPASCGTPAPAAPSSTCPGSMGATTLQQVDGRADHTATLLANGKVLVAGGRNSAGSLPTAELYDPSAGTWTATGPLATARADHTATRLDKPVITDATNDMVLVAGGRTGTKVGTSGGAVLASAELYNPALEVWVPAGPMTDLRADHTATLLHDGRVLMAGGNIGEAGVKDPFLQGAAIITDTSDLYDPATNTHTPTQLLEVPRADHTATLLNDQSCVGSGRTPPCDNVLAVGRIDGNGTLPDGTARGRTTEIYNYFADPTPDIDDYWRLGAPMSAERANHTATKLDTGKVLVTGGVDGAGVPGSTVALGTAELYTP
jgi:hypothetical protein